MMVKTRNGIINDIIEIATAPRMLSCAMYVTHVGNVSQCNKTVNVYSPIESAKVNAIVAITELRITGTITVVIVLIQLAPLLRAASEIVFSGIEFNPLSKER
mgnify:CR=1 FL=1